MSHNQTVQVPPDSTGKRIRTSVALLLPYQNLMSSFSMGDTVTGADSGLVGDVAKINPNESDANLGVITLVIDEDSPVLEAAVGEDLLVLGSKIAEARTIGNPLHTQHLQVAGANNPYNQCHVDRQGALFVRHADGSQQLDGFGLSRFSSPTNIGSYTFTYDELPYHIQTETNGTGASVTHLPDEAAVALDVGTASGESVKRTTNVYHRYQPGTPNIIQMSVACGDSGKSGVSRRWGYYDDQDGFFFELNDTGELIICLRSSVTGTVEEKRVHQNDWNYDRLDGGGGPLNLTELEIDISKVNLFWIDFQWLGTGTVRFGIYADNGNRVIAHAFENANRNNTAYTRTGSLPVRWEIFNTSATASPSRLKSVCCSVQIDGNLVPDRKRRSDKACQQTTGYVTADDTSDTHLMSIRPTATIKGQVNRHITLPELMSIQVKNNPVVLEFWRKSTLSSATWTKEGAVDYSLDATIDEEGHRLFCRILDVGSHNLVMPENFSLQGEKLHLDADGSQSKSYTVTARCLEPASNADVFFALTWIDIN